MDNIIDYDRYKNLAMAMVFILTTVVIVDIIWTTVQLARKKGDCVFYKEDTRNDDKDLKEEKDVLMKYMIGKIVIALCALLCTIMLMSYRLRKTLNENDDKIENIMFGIPCIIALIVPLAFSILILSYSNNKKVRDKEHAQELLNDGDTSQHYMKNNDNCDPQAFKPLSITAIVLYTLILVSSSFMFGIGSQISYGSYELNEKKKYNI